MSHHAPSRIVRISEATQPSASNSFRRHNWCSLAIAPLILLACLVQTGCVGLTSAKSVNGSEKSDPSPSIGTQPISQTVNAGQTATFSIAVSGKAPFTYQWRKNGTAISGTTSSSYTTPSTTPADNGTQFSVVVSNSAGSVTSNAATLTVDASAPAITGQPSSVSVMAGQTAMFSVAATGTAPLTYQWSKGGTVISGATASNYTTPGTTISDNGAQFTVVITNFAGSVSSNAANLTVNPAAVAPTDHCATDQPEHDRGADGDVLGDRDGHGSAHVSVEQGWYGHQRGDCFQLHDARNDDFRQRRAVHRGDHATSRAASAAMPRT